MNPEIIDYIRKNRDNYTREAITQQLLDAGYMPVEIGAAWRVLEGSHFSDDTPSGSSEALDARKAQRFANSPRFWGVLLGYLILSYLVPGLLIYTAISQQGLSELGTFGVIFFVALQVLAIVLGLMNLSKDRPTGMGLLISVLTALVILPCVGIAALYGICFGTFRA